MMNANRNSRGNSNDEVRPHPPQQEEFPLPSWQFNATINPVMSHNRMRLYDDEYEWALDIKDAVEKDPEIDNLTDFHYAQLAIIDQDDIGMAMQRAHKLQAFRRQYDIRESLECGRCNMEAFIDLLPGHWLHLSSAEGHYALVADVSKLAVDQLQSSPQALHIWLAGTYFMCHVLCPDFYAIRHGFTILAENHGYSWKKNFGLDLHRKLWQELTSVYPMQIAKMKNYNTGVIYNMLVSMAKRFVPAEIHSKFETGCEFELGTLDKLYATPTLEAANERLMIRFKDSLQRRYQNEANFKLSELF